MLATLILPSDTSWNEGGVPAEPLLANRTCCSDRLMVVDLVRQILDWVDGEDRLAPAHHVGTICLLGTGIGVFKMARGSTYKIAKDE